MYLGDNDSKSIIFTKLICTLVAYWSRSRIAYCPTGAMVFRVRGRGRGTNRGDRNQSYWFQLKSSNFLTTTPDLRNLGNQCSLSQVPSKPSGLVTAPCSDDHLNDYQA